MIGFHCGRWIIIPSKYFFALGLLLTSIAYAGGIHAVSIQPGDFGPGASFESFEDLSAGPGLDPGPDHGFDDGYLVPITPYAFASGATLNEPDPNPGSQDQAVIGNPNSGFAQFSLGSNGVVSASGQVPFGDAYLGFENPAVNGGTSSVTFVFDTVLLRVGAYLVTSEQSGGPADGIVTIFALDDVGATLESLSLETGDVSNWGDNFVGIQRAEGIHALRIEGPPTVVDGLTFEAIPEPGSGMLLALGLTVLGGRRGRSSPEGSR